MREILFKAKRLGKHEWVVGHLIQLDYFGTTRSWICDVSDYSRLRAAGTEYCDWRTVEVDTKTVCQCAGPTDKHGNKIWENDIVKDISIHLLGSIEWDSVRGKFVINDVHDGCQNFAEYWNCVEVIGNVFDNPELLEV